MSARFTAKDLAEKGIKISNDNGYGRKKKTSQSASPLNSFTNPFVSIDLEEPQRFCFEINAIPYLRMTQGQVELAKIPRNKVREDMLPTWKKVKRYFKYKTDLQQLAMVLRFVMPTSHFHVIFGMEMPQSWSEEMKKSFDNTPHLQTPDNDNLIKAMKDALCKNDSHIWDYRPSKIWSRKGYILVLTNVKELKYNPQ